MKTSKLILVFLFTVMLVSAQTIGVRSRVELKTSSGTVKAYHPVFNLAGDKVLFTSDNYSGLSMFDINSQAVTQISSEAGAGYEPLFNNNDTKIFYRKTSYVEGRKMDAIESYETTNGKKMQMLAPQRDLRNASNFHNGFLVTANKRLLKSTFGKTDKTVSVYVTTQEMQIHLYKNGKFTIINPLNVSDARYIWVSLSPGSDKILFTAAGKGTFVCDLNGKLVSTLGYLNAPVWYDNNYVVGMQDKDDGHVVTSSKIVMVSLNGKVKSEISAKGEIAMYPTASAKVAKIAYNTIDGKVMIADLDIK